MSSGFISETDLAEKRRLKKEQWMTTRKEDEPEDPPEEEPEVYDPRTLYQRLEEQKLKKQEEWEEAHKLKNMVRGLEDDEVDFLEFVDNTKLQEERRIRAEEQIALEQFRQKVAEKKPKESELLAELRNTNKKASTKAPSKRATQMSILAGAIKRKSPESTEEKSSKRARMSESESSKDPVIVVGSSSKKPSGALKCLAVLPGLGEYTDSSDSSDSEADFIHTQDGPCDITGRKIVLK